MDAGENALSTELESIDQFEQIINMDIYTFIKIFLGNEYYDKLINKFSKYAEFE